MAYFNEIEPFAAEWLGNLWPGARVDRRSIAEVTGDDLTDAPRAHFFAGIGGWEYALSLAGWPADREVWTGSCPCQPFSAAGKQKGEADERHLWPEFRRLIVKRRPATVFGEQVASKLGREWLAGVRADLEALGYAVGAADLCAAGVGAPHIRQRLYWVAHAERGAAKRHGLPVDGTAGRVQGEARERQRVWADARDGVAIGGLAHAERDTRGTGWAANGPGESAGAPGARTYAEPGRCGDVGGAGHAVNAGLEGYAGNGENGDKPGWHGAATPGPAWAASVAIPCLDGKWRRVPANEAGEPEPRFFPLAHGATARVGRLRAYGNAIVPQVAAAFIRAFLDAERSVAA